MIPPFSWPPHDASAYFGRGLAKRALNKTSEAKQDFQIALKFATQASKAELKNDIEGFLRQGESNSEGSQVDIELKDDVEDFLRQFIVKSETM